MPGGLIREQGFYERAGSDFFHKIATLLLSKIKLHRYVLIFRLPHIHTFGYRLSVL